jgi:hypothetical protein
MLDSTKLEGSGDFLEIVRPERVVLSWGWQGGLEDPGESRIEVTPMVEDWTGLLDKLEARFARGAYASLLLALSPRRPGECRLVLRLFP